VLNTALNVDSDLEFSNILKHQPVLITSLSAAVREFFTIAVTCDEDQNEDPFAMQMTIEKIGTIV
jgi:hypothetical protein